MDVDAKKKALRTLTYGLYVVTATAEGEFAAGTVSWLSQASFTPPMVVVGLKAGSRLQTHVEANGAFAVNILGAEQQAIAGAFFRLTDIEPGRLNGYAFEPGPTTDAPLLLDAPAWFEARIVHTFRGGDHVICVAEVVNAGVRDAAAKPLALRDTPWSYAG